MTHRRLRYGSAARASELRPMTADEAAEHRRHADLFPPSAATYEPFRLFIVNREVLDGFQHGIAGDATLCGIPQSEVFLMRHLFWGRGSHDCPTCSDRMPPKPAKVKIVKLGADLYTAGAFASVSDEGAIAEWDRLSARRLAIELIDEGCTEDEIAQAFSAADPEWQDPRHHSK